MTNHLFALQVLCLAILWVIKTIKSISIIFPLMVCALSVHSQKLRIDTFKCCQKWTCGWFLNTLCFQEKFYRKRQRNVGALLVGRYFCRVSVVKKDTTDWWFVNFLVQKKKKKKKFNNFATDRYWRCASCAKVWIGCSLATSWPGLTTSCPKPTRRRRRKRRRKCWKKWRRMHRKRNYLYVILSCVLCSVKWKEAQKKNVFETRMSKNLWVPKIKTRFRKKHQKAPIAICWSAKVCSNIFSSKIEHCMSSRWSLRTVATITMVIVSLPSCSNVRSHIRQELG